MNREQKFKLAVIILSAALVVLAFVAGYYIAKAETLDRDRGLAKMATRVRDVETRVGWVEDKFDDHDDYAHVDHGDLGNLRREMERYGGGYDERLREYENRVRWMVRVLVFGEEKVRW